MSRMYNHVNDGFESDPNSDSNRVMGFLSKRRPTLLTKDYVMTNQGLKLFIDHVYKITFISVLITLGLPQFFDFIGVSMATMISLSIVGIVTGFASLITFLMSDYTIHSEAGHYSHIYYAVDSPVRRVAFNVFLLSESLVLMPLIKYANQIDPHIVPITILATSSIMLGASYYAYNTRANSLLLWEHSLVAGLWGLIGFPLVSLISYMIFGPNVLTDLIFSYEPYLGIILFTLFVAYDTHKMIQRYERKDPDHLHCAIEFYLDFLNIFIRILDILIKEKTKNKKKN